METYENIILSKRYIKQENCYDTENVSVHQFDNEVKKIDNNHDEPIDLTVTSPDSAHQKRKKIENVDLTAPTNNDQKNKYIQSCRVNTNFEPRVEAQAFQIVNSADLFNQTAQDVCVSKRRKRRKFVYTNEGKLVLLTEDKCQDPQTFTQTKQLEILKAAKSLFSKRTRTLYHWMYPSTSKQQIKSTVLTSWDSLDEGEKAFYISQVLGRFGFSQSSLMINPQLCSLKELPPPAEKTETQPKSKELQSAISSITSDPNRAPVYINSLTFEEFEALRERSKKRRGRPKVVKKLKNIKEDFQDDPELSNELEKFAVQFNLNKFY